MTLQKTLLANLHQHTTKFVILKLLFAPKVKMRWVNCKLHLIVVKVKPLLPSVPRAAFLSFLKIGSCLPIQAFQKAKEHNDRGWHVTSCKFCLLVKNNVNACVVIFISFLSNVCWTHANRKLSLQQSCSNELRRCCCKSFFL